MNIKDSSVKYFSQNSATLGGYLSDIRKYKVPTAEEEEQLFERYMNGDESAVEEIVLRNQRFIYSIAKKYARDEEEVCDYVNEGTIGMIEAIRTFDPSKGFKFITYAVWYIRRAMKAYLDNRELVRKTNNQKVGKKPDEIRRKYYAEHGVYPSDEEILEIMETVYNVKVNKNDIQSLNIASIQDEVGDDYTMEDDSYYNKVTASENAYETDVEKEYAQYQINKLLSIMDGMTREKDMIQMLYGVGYDRTYSPAEVGEKHNIDTDDVEAIEKKILVYLRQNVSVVA